jgi:pimeloyl-ACP methyl ester carboxylesterase
VTPDGPGPIAFTTTTSTLAMPDNREVGLTTMLPGTTAAPVVVFHHGFNLDSALYTSTAEHLASHGVAVVLLDMPTALFGGPSHSDLADYVGLVMDHLEAEADGAFGGRIDPARIVLAGHSLGGKISLLTAARDARPIGVFAIDPVDTPGGPGSRPSEANPSVAPELMPDITVPVGVIGETTNATCAGLFCQPCAPEGDNFQRYVDAATGPLWMAEVAGANHMSFLDNPDCGFTCSACGDGTDDPAETRRLTRRFLLSFVQLVAENDTCGRSWLIGGAIDDLIDDGLLVTTTARGL